MNDYGPITDKGERKAAASSMKKMLRKLLSGSFQEKFIIIDSPNENQNDWMSMFNIARELGVETVGIGFQLEKNEQSLIFDEKNEHGKKLTMFNATMYKYYWIKNEHDVGMALNDLSIVVD